MLSIGMYILFTFGVFVMLQTLFRDTWLRHHKPISCAVCMGFWTGFLFSGIFFTGIGWKGEGLVLRFVWAFISAGSCSLINTSITGDY